MTASSALIKRVAAFIEKNELLTNDGRPLIVAVSGGADSVALLEILLRLGYKCVIAHCNFHLRSVESNDDNIFVRKLAEQLKTPIYSIDFNTVEHADNEGISIEMAARELRYDWFEELRLKLEAQAIVTGHHLDDNLETILLNIVRGTGLRGLTGMPMRNGQVVRPLLDTSHQELVDFLREQGIEWREDSSNATNDYQRNRIRNQVLPLLEDINPSVRKTMARSRRILEGSYQLFQEKMDALRGELISKEGDRTFIPIAQLQQTKDIDTVLYELLADYHFSAAQLEQIIEAMAGQPGKMFFSTSHRLLINRHELILEPLSTNTSYEQLIESVDQSEAATGLQMRTFDRTVDFHYSSDAAIVHLDAAMVRFPLVVRSWKEGDSFQPLGMKGNKKLSDFLTDQKLDRFSKEKVRVLCSEGAIVWVVGLRLADPFKVTSDTKHILEIKSI